MPRLIDMTGKRFGRITVINYDGNGRWNIVCDCGIEKSLIGSDIRRTTRSCGCLNSENMRDRNFRHGEARRGAKSVEYTTWAAMRRRCSDQKYKDYSYYGGRGISVCDRWANDFHAFLEDVGRRPGKHYSIDRIDNNRNYEPGNVRWANHSSQMKNRRPFKQKTHCKHGHEFTPDNTYIWTDGSRKCRECCRAIRDRKKKKQIAESILRSHMKARV